MPTHLSLTEMGLTPMSEFEMRKTNGGLHWLTWVASAVAAVGLFVGATVLYLGVAVLIYSLITNGDGTVIVTGSSSSAPVS